MISSKVAWNDLHRSAENLAIGFKGCRQGPDKRQNRCQTDQNHQAIPDE